MNGTTRVIGITGFKNSGKTTLVERLVAEFTARGLNVSTIKHAHHTFDIDHKGRDSFRHRKAGAREVAVISRNQWAIIRDMHEEPEPSLAEILSRMKHKKSAQVLARVSPPIALRLSRRVVRPLAVDALPPRSGPEQ